MIRNQTTLDCSLPLSLQRKIRIHSHIQRDSVAHELAREEPNSTRVARILGWSHLQRQRQGRFPMEIVNVSWAARWTSSVQSLMSWNDAEEDLLCLNRSLLTKVN